MLRFHWRLPQGGERPNASRAHQASLRECGLPDLVAQTPFSQAAEESGIDSLLLDFGWSKPDPILLAAALGLQTTKVRFIVAHRSGLACPTAFVQQINTLATLIGDRFSLNVVAGHSPEEQRGYGDTLAHDERYERTDEYLAVCHAFWSNPGDVSFHGKYYDVAHGRLNTPFESPERRFPEIYIAGNSPPARRLSITRGTCWMRLPDVPEKVGADAAPVIESGKEVGLRFSMIARPTREEAIEAAHALVASVGSEFDDKGAERQHVKRTDSVSMKAIDALADEEWPAPWLWTGAVRSHGAAAIALVGSPDDIATGILEYANVGVSQFIISGWPKLDEMLFFGRHILPIIRRREHELRTRRRAC